MKVTNLFTEKDREVFDRIDRDCLAMHVVPPPKTFLKLEVRDAAGELTDVYEDRAHSWVRNHYNNILHTLYAFQQNIGATFEAGSLKSKNVAGNLINNAFNAVVMALGDLGEARQGIVVGTGSGAESFESFALTQIGHGNAAGQLSHTLQTVAVPAYDAGTRKWTVATSRIFNNNSGSDIVVAEVGFGNLVSSTMVLKCRDLLAEAKTIPNAGQLTVTYTIEMTFPA